MATLVTVDGVMWERDDDGSYYRGGEPVAPALVPRGVASAVAGTARARALARAVEASRLADEVEAAHDEAATCDFVLAHYVPGSSPRAFTLPEYVGVVDAGVFAVECTRRFGWPDGLSVATLYVRVNAVLLECGHRVRQATRRAPHQLSEDGVGHYPQSLAEAV